MSNEQTTAIVELVVAVVVLFSLAWQIQLTRTVRVSLDLSGNVNSL